MWLTSVTRDAGLRGRHVIVRGWNSSRHGEQIVEIYIAMVTVAVVDVVLIIFLLLLQLLPLLSLRLLLLLLLLLLLQLRLPLLLTHKIALR